MNQILPILI